MTSIFDSQSIGIPCPNCSEKTEQTVAWLKANNAFTCACGTVINLDSNELIRGFEEAEKSIAKLRESFRRFGK